MRGSRQHEASDERAAAERPRFWLSASWSLGLTHAQSGQVAVSQIRDSQVPCQCTEPPNYLILHGYFVAAESADKTATAAKNVCIILRRRESYSLGSLLTEFAGGAPRE